MLRFFVNLIASVVLAALALIVASLLIPGVHLQARGFVVAVIVFTVAQGFLTPWVISFARRYAAAVLGGIGLVSTLLSLIIASLFSGGLSIEGVEAWVLAPLVVWIVTALGGWLIVGVLLKRWLDNRRVGRRAGA